MVTWERLMRSGQRVAYNGLPFEEVVALATALDEWEQIMRHRHPGRDK